MRPRWFSKFGQTRGKWLDPLNIPGDLRCRVEPDSAYPRTNEDVRRDTANAMGLGWGTGQNQPHVDEHISTVFNLPKGPNDYDDWKVKAEKRLDALKFGYEALTEFGIAGETAVQFMIEQMTQICRPNPKLDSHQAFIRFWTEYYLSDEYDELPQEVQTAIDLLVTEHEFAMYEEMQEKMLAEDAVVDPLKQKARAEADEDAEKQDRREGKKQIRSAAIGTATSKQKQRRSMQ